MKRKFRHSLFSKANGFTLIEVIIVLTILAILASMLVPTFTGYIDKTHKDECEVIRRTLYSEYKAKSKYYETLTISAFLADKSLYVTYDVCPCGGEWIADDTQASGDFHSIKCSFHG